MKVYLLFLAGFMGSALGCGLPKHIETDKELLELKTVLSRSNLVPKGEGKIPPMSMSDSDGSFFPEDGVDLSDEWTLEFDV